MTSIVAPVAARAIASWIRPDEPVWSETVEGATVRPRKFGWKPGVIVSASVPLFSQGVKSMRLVVAVLPAVDLTLAATAVGSEAPYQFADPSSVAVPPVLSRKKRKLLVLPT